MVFPIGLIAGLAGSAVNAIGSALAGREQANNEIAAIKARNKVVKKELKRQNRYTRKAADVFTDSLDLFDEDRVDRRMDKADAQTTRAVMGNLPTEFGTIGSMLAPAALAKDEAAFAAEGADKGAAFGDSLGQLLSHDQWLFNNDRALAKKAHKLGNISDFARGSATVNAIEQAVAAGNVQPQQSIWGPLLQAGGTIGSYLAGRGGISLPTKPLIQPATTMY